MDLRFEGVSVKGFSNLLMSAAAVGRIDHAVALLDHGANVNKAIARNGFVVSPLTVTMSCGAHDICRLFLMRGATQPPTTWIKCFASASERAKEKTLALVEMSQ